MRELGYESQLTSGDTLAVRQQSFRRDGHVYDVPWDVTNSPVVRDLLAPTFPSAIATSHWRTAPRGPASWFRQN
jgi:hypothetical protein